MSNANTYVLGIYALESLDSIYICPVPELPSSVDLRSNRGYEVVDYDGNKLFYAAEDVSCQRVCSESRSFKTEMYDLNGRSCLTASRSLSCSLCLCGTDCFCNCCNETVAKCGDHSFGRVITFPSCTRPMFIVEDGNETRKFSILGPSWGYWAAWRLCRIIEFPICLPDSNNISLGKIRLGYDGLNEENVPNPQAIGIIFPPHCDVQTKACLVAAGFMLDVTYFNNRGRTASRYIRRIVYPLGASVLIGFLIYFLLFKSRHT